MIRIENEYQIGNYMDYVPRANSVLNIDLDFFAPEMNFIDEEEKLKLIRNLLGKVKCVTIATSPYFIDQ
jgi:homogentisate 1,2-dioxygenase